MEGKGPRVRITFELPRPLAEALRYRAESEYRSLSSVMREAAANHLKSAPEK